jgi:sulfite exporter TauE/SafE
MDVETATPLAAFVVGLSTSLHCSLMCGPLACAVRARPLTYHASRLVSYTLAGALCGGLGAMVAGFLRGDLARFTPWALALVLVFMALGWEKRLPAPRWLAVFFYRLRLRHTLGWFTPLIPCGPLWLMLGVAAVAGSAWTGAGVMGSFAAGTIPLYLLLQSQVARLQSRFSPKFLRISQQTLALIAASLLITRTVLAPQGCCH